MLLRSRSSLRRQNWNISVLALALALAGWLAAGGQDVRAQSPQSTLTSSSPESGGNFGDGLATADVTGDGTSDFIVGATQENTDAGRVHYLDGTDGSEIRMVVSPNASGGSGGFGETLDLVGDVNGDDTPDLIVGAEGETVDGNTDAGRAYIVSGTDGAILEILEAPTPTGGGAFGQSVAGIGNVGGNGDPDVAVGEDGSAYVYDGDNGSRLYTISRPSVADADFGTSVAGIQDVGGGSTPDVLVSGEESAGSEQGVGHVFAVDGADGSLISAIGGSDGIEEPGGDMDTGFGELTASISSVNGDGTPDILIGAPGTMVSGVEAGQAYVFDGTDGTKIGTIKPPNPESEGEFGTVSAVGDLTGDNVPEIAVGAPGETAGGLSSAGRVYLFDGANGTRLGNAITSPNKTDNPLFEAPNGGLGTSFARLGDLDGNGKPEVFVGAPHETVGGTGGAGRAYVLRGEELAPTASASKSVDGDGLKDFGSTGIDVNFSNTSGSGTVAVEKFTGGPIGTDGISESTVSSYRFTIKATGGVSTGSGTKVRFEVATLGGVSTPSDVSVYKRSPAGEGSFSSVSTSYDGSDEIVATVSGFSEFVLASDNNSLPVELADFTVRASDGDALLRWQTASETNNAGFEVQHRSPASDSWATLDFVESKASGGTSTNAFSYRFRAETETPGTHRFRLRQVDADGTATLTDPVALQIRMKEALRLSPPAPNPVSDDANFSFAVKEASRATVTVYNSLGQRVATLYEGRVPGGEPQHLQVSTSDLPSGMYVLRLQANGQTRTQRVTVVR